MKSILTVHWILVAALWYFVNGILHDVFVYINHKGKYDRELLRLLMDGHVLILSGIVMFVCYLMMLSKIQCGALVAIIVAAAMLIYCIMIFPFLKSIGTMFISLIAIMVCINLYSTFPDIWEVMRKYRE